MRNLAILFIHFIAVYTHRTRSSLAAGTLGGSHSTAPFRHRSEAFDTASPSTKKRSRLPPTALSQIRLHGTDFHVSKKVWQECDGRRNGHEDK